MVYALVGSNTHAIRKRIEALRAQFSGDTTTVRLDGQELEFADIIQAVGGQSLFASANFVVVKDMSKNKQARDKLEDLIEATADDSVLILVETDVDKRTSYYKNLKKRTNFEEYKDLDPGQAAEFVKQFVRQEQGDISSGDAMFLVSRLGTDQALLAGELEKLIQYDRSITKETIERLTEPSFQDTIFQLIDALSSGHKRKAQQIYEGLRKSQIHPLEIVGTLSWQIHNLVQIKVVGNMPPHQISKTLGMAPFVVNKNLSVVRRLDLPRLNALVDATIRADETLKSKGLDPDDVVETLLIEAAELITS